MVLAALCFHAPIPAFAADVRSGTKSEIDVANRNDGYIRARSKLETSRKLKIQTSHMKSDGTKVDYNYDLTGTGDWETFSLQSGNGKYMIGIFESVTGGKYAQIQSINIDVEYSRKNAPFLVSVQNINYNAGSNAVKKAEELIKGASTDLEKVGNIYKYIVETIKYDTDKANKIISGVITDYVPRIDDTLATSKGICYDYSSLLAAMLRSQDIPAKLVKGFVAIDPKPSYHAWNEVYIENVGWIRIRSEVYFDGKDWERVDTTFASGNANGKRTKFLRENKNYAKDQEF